MIRFYRRSLRSLYRDFWAATTGSTCVRSYGINGRRSLWRSFYWSVFHLVPRLSLHTPLPDCHFHVPQARPLAGPPALERTTMPPQLLVDCLDRRRQDSELNLPRPVSERPLRLGTRVGSLEPSRLGQGCLGVVLRSLVCPHSPFLRVVRGLSG